MILPLTCPICKKQIPVVADGIATFHPFCSERCRQVDLMRWFDGKYAITEPLNPELLEEGELPSSDEAD